MIEQMRLNPLISIRTFQSQKTVLNIQTAAPKKDSSIKIYSFIKSKDEIFFDKVEKILLNQDNTIIATLTKKEFDILVTSNILIKDNEKSNFPKYICSVKKPVRVNAVERPILNKNSFFSSLKCPPMEVAQRCPNARFDLAFGSLAGESLWVKEYITGAWWPYSLKTIAN